MDSPLNLDPGSPSSTTRTDLPVPLKKFFQGEPLALGVQGALAMNAISAITAGIGIIFLGLTITIFTFHFKYICSKHGIESRESCPEIYKMEGILAVLTVFNLLELCIATSFASFGCKMLCRNAFTETVVVIYQNAPPASAENPSIGCKEPESP
ncbi:membrane-spanning 4-domains subfamily A member 4A-like [Ahaetulla prasina]|uniref:membrane-spanning 4-domains subfamily A member 4A-like n=1 Tax=Ahaetulla prasina TaxID=499056 RepID=UPI00264A143A|nr:membrane-spanning 4-domains subfamily A member 4A-like [Ahaetulla prasina]